MIDNVKIEFAILKNLDISELGAKKVLFCKKLIFFEFFLKDLYKI